MAEAEAWGHICVNKTLLYMQARVLHILPLHGTVYHEQTIDVRAMLDQAVPESRGTRNYVFRPLHYADDYVSCIYVHHRNQPGDPDLPESWLVIFNPTTRFNTSCRIARPHNRLFVRNNSKHLVYGTYTSRQQLQQFAASILEHGLVRRRGPDHAGGAGGAASPSRSSGSPSRNGHNNVSDVIDIAHDEMPANGRQRRWSLRHLNLATRTWSPQSIVLDKAFDLSDFGSGICFDIIDGHLYALTNEPRCEAVDEDNDDDGGGAGGEDEGEGQGRGGGISHDDEDSFRQYGENTANAPTHKPTSPVTAPDATAASSNPPWPPPSSYYVCRRIRLSSPDVRDYARFWRRCNNEGTLDDRWNTIRQHKSAVTGDVVVSESRKEWLNGVEGMGGGVRTYYRRTLFARVDKNAGANAKGRDNERGEGRGRRNWNTGNNNNNNNNNNDDDGDGDGNGHNTTPNHDDESGKPRRCHDVGKNDEDEDEYDNYVCRGTLYPHRTPEEVHTGDADNDKTRLPLVLSESAARLFNGASDTHLDLVNAPTQDAPSTQNLVLQAGTRDARPPSQGESAQSAQSSGGGRPPARSGSIGHGTGEDGGLQRVHGTEADTTRGSDGADNPLYPLQAIQQRYVARSVPSWPRPSPKPPRRRSAGGESVEKTKDDGTDGKEGQANPNFQVLTEIVNPTGFQGSISTYWDDRVLVYATGGGGSITIGGSKKANCSANQSIVVVSFDPSFCLPGLRAYEEQKGRRGYGRLGQGGCGEEQDHEMQDGGGTAGGETELGLVPSPVGDPMLGTTPSPPPAQSACGDWVSSAEPTYLRLNRGFDFTCHV